MTKNINNLSIPLEEPQLNGYVSPCERFAAIPYGKAQYIIIFDGSQVRTCRSITTAKTYIQQERKKLK